jgi:hypothetical protein
MTSPDSLPSPAPLSAALSSPMQRKLLVQLARWREDLLPLDRRQKLLNFKHSRTSSLEIVEPEPAEVLRRIEVGRARFQIATGGRSPSATSLLVRDKTETELARSLRQLEQQSNKIYADRGFWPLHLALGMLEWVDADGEDVVSPVLLVPVRIRRDGVGTPYRTSRTEDEPRLNPVLRLKLEKDFGITLPDVDEDITSVEAVLDEVAATVAGQAEWRVTRRAVLAPFYFHKEAMYRDLLDHEELISDHSMVQLVVLGPEAPGTQQFAFDPVDDDELDTAVPPEELHSILDADGSQRRCILAARDGRSFVMDGPPGTGKSQTIANIIAELISSGRTVLFVSEKAAALDVVRNRLAGKGLGEFLLELHSHAATRKQVVRELDLALKRSVVTSGRFGLTEHAKLTRAREDLSGYAAAMNEVRPQLGRSLHNVLGRLAELHSCAEYAVDSDPAWGQLPAHGLTAILESAEQLSRVWRPAAEGLDFPWGELASTELSARQIKQLEGRAREASVAARALADRMRLVDLELGLSFPLSTDGARRRFELLNRLAEAPAAPAHWLSAGSLAPLASRAEELAAAAGRYQDDDAYLRARLGDQWRDLDVDRRDDLAVLDSTGAAAQVLGSVPDPAMTASRLGELVSFLESSPGRLTTIQDDARRVAGIFGLPADRLGPRRAAELARLAALADRSVLPEAGWFHPAVQNALDESCRVLGDLVAQVREHEAAVAGVFTRDALDLDLATLEVRFRETHVGLHRFSAQARADRKALKAVTVAGRVTTEVLARLGAAARWQQAQRRLAAAETEHAPRLGASYRRTETDFAALSSAIQTAREALRLAGENVDTVALAGQLSKGAASDPALPALAHRLSRNVDPWRDELGRQLGSTVVPADDLPVEDAAVWCGELAAALRPGRAAVEHVAGVAGRDVSLGEAAQLLTQAASAATASAVVLGDADEDRRRFGSLYAGLRTEWERLRAALRWADGVREVVQGPLRDAEANRLLAATVDAGDLHEVIETWESARDELGGHFAHTRAVEFVRDLDADVPEAGDLLERMSRTASVDIEEWCQYSSHRAELTELGFEDVLDELIKARAPAGIVAAAVEHAALQAWADAIIRSDPRLRTFRAADRDALVHRFRELDERLISHAHTRVAAACGRRRPRTLTSRAAQVIGREAQKKNRHKPIRRLLGETRELVQEIKPCFMMSPLSVSQYLPSDFHFDVVIFDEASQVLPADAAGCLYRGRQLIVAGDQKQLPPTRFFAFGEGDSGAIADEDDDPLATDDFDSVLDLCKAAGALPSLPLTWHYRSRHEALITYSNYRFYDGLLHTFPGASFDSPDLGVAAFVVDGVYRRGSTRDNPLEAEKVVDRVLHHRTEHPDLSIGVVTFSSAQEDAVVAALDRRAETEPLLAGLLGEQDRLDGFFVKSLESVQGDERDVIVFSIGYGPDEAGKFIMNFGPLNRPRGWRRLNVAVTRARRRVEIVSSFRPEQLKSAPSEGLRHLRGYLDFAHHGLRALSVDGDASGWPPESPFEADVLSVIRGWGYEADVRVGAAGYRIDVAVRHPDRPGSYVLAVECDGAVYDSAKTARDRDRLREEILRGLGWRMHRIWGVSWVRDRATQVDRLQRAIEAAIKGVAEPAPPAEPWPSPSVVVVKDVVADDDVTPSWTEPYVMASPLPRLGKRDPASPEARPTLAAFYRDVLATEAPIHESMLVKRLSTDLGVGRVTARIRENVLAALTHVRVDGATVTRDRAGFYRIEDRPPGGVRVPVGSVPVRDVGQVPPEELELAIANTVQDAVIARPEDVATSVARVFAWGGVRPEIQAAVDAAISALVDRGELERTQGGSLRSTDRS